MLYCCASAILDASCLDECMITRVSTCMASHSIVISSRLKILRKEGILSSPNGIFQQILYSAKKKYCFQKHQSEKFKYYIEQQLFETGFGRTQFTKWMLSPETIAVHL